MLVLHFEDFCITQEDEILKIPPLKNQIFETEKMLSTVLTIGEAINKFGKKKPFALYDSLVVTL